MARFAFLSKEWIDKYNARSDELASDQRSSGQREEQGPQWLEMRVTFVDAPPPNRGYHLYLRVSPGGQFKVALEGRDDAIPVRLKHADITRWSGQRFSMVLKSPLLSEAITIEGDAFEFFAWYRRNWPTLMSSTAFVPDWTDFTVNEDWMAASR